MTGKQPPQNEDTFHRARSKLIDSFARLETYLAKALVRAGRPVKGDTLASKLKTIRDAAALDKLTTQSKKFDRLAELTAIRADLVHGPMTIIDIHGERFAHFRNAREAVNGAQKCTQVTYKYMKSLSEELQQLSTMIESLEFNPASSPPQPSQDAAGDP